MEKCMKMNVVVMCIVVCFQTGLLAQEWSVDLTVTGTAVSGDIVQVCTFGGNSTAADNYDPLDEISPPVPMSFYSYFEVSGFPPLLINDIKNWVAPYDVSKTWDFHVVNTSQSQVTGVTIDWDPSGLPAMGSFVLEGAGSINMRAQNSISFSGDKNYTIRYTPNIPPTADADGPYVGRIGQAVVFDGSGSSDPDQDILTYDWDFGDGSPHGSGVNPAHVYGSAGNYEVILVVNDSKVDSEPDTTAARIYSWYVDLDVSGDGGFYTRTFGGDPSGTDGFDAGLDTIAPPPPPDIYYTYFQIPVTPNSLATDFRHWDVPYDTDIDWSLVVTNAGGVTTTVTWDISDLPEEGYFYLEGASLINMRNQNSVSFEDSRTLTIKYRKQVEVMYDFTQQGWYMVSLPVIPEDSSVTTLFPTVLGSMAFGWDPVSGAYSVETEIATKYGYWIAISGATTSQVCGGPLNNYTIHCGIQGWYMIGSVLGGADFTNPDDNPDGQVLSPAFGWNTGTGSYYTIATLEEKNGYWVAVFGACDLTVGGGGGGFSKAFSQSDWSTFDRVHGSTPPAPPDMDWTTGEMVQVPTTYGLSQNTPNPFNPQTIIRYQLPENGHVSLIIYNMMGQEVNRLVDGNKEAGYYEIIWNGRDELGDHVGSGVYLVMYQVGEYTKVGKLILER